MVQLTPPAVLSLLASKDEVFDQETKSGLEICLPAETTKHLAIRLADRDHPLYLILVTLSNPVHEFTVADVDFVRNLGALLVTKSMQNRMISDDEAKTNFLSAISHELRTPMHAVTVSHDLMREAVTEGRTADYGPLLTLSQSSSRTLTNILNDVLDFGKGRAGHQAENRNKLVPDLVTTVIQTVKAAESQYVAESNDVAISVEYDERNWATHVDEARFQR